MKKTFTINLSGIVFHIDEDAYEKLKNYLQMLTKHFGSGTEGQEILMDIESRLAELFSEKKKEEAKDVISVEWVDEVIARLGKPEDFMEDQEPGQTYGEHKTRVRRRLYRNPANRVFGGVCSGIGAFFNIDTVIVRVLFFIAFWFTASVAFWVYIILWIAVPKAATTAQRLEMRGEDATVSNIEKKIKEEIRDVKENYNKFKSSETYKHGRSSLSHFGDTLYDIVKVLARIAIVLIGIFCIATGFLGAISLLATVFLGHSLINILPWINGHDITLFEMSGFFISGTVAILLKTAIVLLGIIPLLALLFAGLKLLFNFKSNDKAIFLSGLVIWIVALIFAVTMVLTQINKYSSHTTTSQSSVIDCNRCETLYIELDKDHENYAKSYDFRLANNRIKLVAENGETFFISKPRFSIEESDNGNFVMLTRKKARGRNSTVAKANAENISYRFAFQDSILRLNNYFRPGADKRWFDQELDIVLKVPAGKSVWIGKEMTGILNEARNVTNTRISDMAGKFWEMTPQGLQLKE